MSNRTRQRPVIHIHWDRPFVYPYQKAFMDNKERFTVVEGATKIGKTTPMIFWLLEQALKGKPGQTFWWVAPIRAQAKMAFDRMRNKIDVRNFFKVNESNLTLTLPGGSIIHFKSADNPDSLYGEDVYAVVFDEASRAQEASWFAIRSTLTSTGGKCKFIANVVGRGWYYKLALKARSGEDPEYRHFKVTGWDAVMTGPLSVDEVKAAKAKILGHDDDNRARMEEVYNKLLAHAYSNFKPLKKKARLPLKEVVQAKSELPPHVFRQLYEAETSDDGGNPFGVQNLDRAKRKGLGEGPATSYGIDLASRVDFTVEVGLNEEKEVCHFKRYQMDWEQTTNTISNLPDIPTAVDGTGVGAVIVERMQKGRRYTESFIFSQQSKQRLIEALATAFQNNELTFPEGGALEDELYSFEYSYSRSGGLRYSAPEGLNDDCVMALALAYDQHRHQPPTGGARARRVPTAQGRTY
ncbi:hypothetical protein IC229_27550 [Spirosoma sp. BT702]|uniref:Terminase n=1 Tax=Spirosoma profusum TaxID=2771354 RepID=A0A927AUI1_9BACT|nr:terminase family protein [Spirosoma profusum]MBD2704427.1 hypothetical protein [Spirosoma profusum]